MPETDPFVQTEFTHMNILEVYTSLHGMETFTWYGNRPTSYIILLSGSPTKSSLAAPKLVYVTSFLTEALGMGVVMNMNEYKNLLSEKEHHQEVLYRKVLRGEKLSSSELPLFGKLAKKYRSKLIIHHK